MMHFFENKKIFQKIIIAICIIALFSFIFASRVNAKKDEGQGGKLLRPVASLLLGLDDGLMDFLHNSIVHQNKAYITVDLTDSFWEKAGHVIATGFIGLLNFALAAVLLCAAVAVVPAVLAVFGIGAGAAAALGASAGMIAVVSTAAGVIGGFIFSQNNMPDDMVIPLYYITPEEIISGQITVFDADFFNPDIGSEKRQINAGSVEQSNNLQGKEAGNNSYIEAAKNWLKFDKNSVAQSLKSKYGIKIDANSSILDFKTVPEGQRVTRYIGIGEETNEKGKKEAVGVYIAYLQETHDMSRGWTKEDAKYFLSTKKAEYTSTAYKLRNAIGTWYKTLRYIALVGSLSILIYIAIRIIMSSSSSDKSKYKQRLFDWLVSICLIFVMHYIMAGSNLFVKQLSGLLNSVQKPTYAGIIQDCNKDKIKNALEDNKYLIDEYYGKDVDIESLFYEKTENGQKNEYFSWPTNLMGTVRLKAQYIKDDNGVTFAGYTIMFTALVLITLMFTWIYLKRVTYLALLTILAPFVAMTYALDKLKDGSAQGFNNWFKEYMVNLLIQPIHLLLYTVLVSSAIELAESNLVYSIVALGFMLPAEKLVRRFFGVNATETQGLLSGAAGGALAMGALNRLLSNRPQGPKDTSGKENQKDKKDKITFKEDTKTNQLFTDPNQKPSDNDGSDGNNGGNKTTNKNDSGEDTQDQPSTINEPTEDQTQFMPDDINEDLLNADNENSPEENRPNLIQLKDEDQSSSEDNNQPTSTRQPQQPQQPQQAKAQPKTKQQQTKPQPISQQIKPQITPQITPQQAKQQPDNSKTTKKKISPQRSIMRGLGRGLKYYGRNVLENVAENWQPGSGIKKVAKAGVGVGAGALAGMIGAASGIANGDVRGTWQNTAAAAFAGYKFGSSPNPDLPGAMKVENAGEYFARGYYGDEEYERIQDEKKMKKMIEEKMNDEFVKQFSLRTKIYDENKAKEALQQDDFLENSLKHGFYDANEMAALYEAMQKYHDMDKAQASVKVVRDTGVDINTFEYDNKKKEAFIKSLEEKYRANNDNVNEKQMRTFVNSMYNDLKDISDVYYTA